MNKTSRIKNLKKEFVQKEKELLFGSLLGDGYLNFKYIDKVIKGNIRFSEEHGFKQKEYLKYKSEILIEHLSDKGFSERKRIDKRFKNPEYLMYTLRTKANISFKEFYDLFYIERKKIIPKDLSLLTPYAIAIWFMDDGLRSPHGYFLCTNNFELQDIKRICKELKTKYNIFTSINSKKQIYIKACSKNDFTNLVKKFIIPSMEYKLH